MGKKGKVLLLCLMAIVLFSCQEEENTINTSADTLLITSDLTSLLKRVTMAETSIDNAIDSSNCIEMQLPVTVDFLGGSYQVANQLSFPDFQNIPAGFYNGLQFPITLTRPDHSTITVTSQAEFDAEGSACSDVEESINCVNLNYPIEVFEYDSGNQIQDSYTFSSDAEFYAYLTNLQEGFYFTLGFPVSATFGNGDSATVNSNAELLQMINDSYANCALSLDPSICLPVYLRPGLVAFYGFQNGSLDDEVGQMHFENFGNVQSASDRNGNENCAVQFNYVTQSYLSAENTSALNNLDGLTLSFWYQPGTDLTDYEALVSRGEGLQCPDRFGQWSVGLYDNRRAVFGAYNSAWSNVFSQQNVWYHLVATWSQASGVMSIYVDGQLQETVSGVANCGGQAVTVEDIGNLVIGRNYTGKIDDLAIYNRPLLNPEIQALFTLEPCCGQ